MRPKTAADTPYSEPVALDRPGIPAELLFLAIVLILSLFFSLAGIPGQATPVAGEGSEKLRKGWLEQEGLSVGGTAEPALADEATTADEAGLAGEPDAGAGETDRDADGEPAADARAEERRQGGR